MDANLLHISFEGRHLEDPSAEAEEDMWRWTSRRSGARCGRVLDVDSRRGDIVALNGDACRRPKS
jgi:argininosuccinate synthase